MFSRVFKSVILATVCLPTGRVVVLSVPVPDKLHISAQHRLKDSGSSHGCEISSVLVTVVLELHLQLCDERNS